jgi:hypothetical protein
MINSELRNNQGIAVDMIDTLMGGIAVNHIMGPFRLFKKTVQQGRSEQLKIVSPSLLVDVVLGWPG